MLSGTQEFDKKLDKILLKNKDFKFKFLSKLLLVLVLLVFAFDLFAAECVRYSSSGVQGSTGLTYKVYYDHSDDVNDCQYSAILTATEYAVLKEKSEQMQDIEDITAVSVAQSFTWGFGTYIYFWFLSYCIKAAREVIKSI